MLIGIAFSAAGQIREHRQEALATMQPQGRYRAAVFVAILCGILAPMLNYSFAFGQDIAVAAVRLGNPEVRGVYAVWPIGLAGGLPPNVGYSIYLLRRNWTGALFQSKCLDVFWAILVANLWMGAVALYGMSVVYLGRFGTSIGWGALPDLHDYDRNRLRRVHGRVETCSAFRSSAPELEHYISGWRDGSFGICESIRYLSSIFPGLAKDGSKSQLKLGRAADSDRMRTLHLSKHISLNDQWFIQICSNRKTRINP